MKHTMYNNYVCIFFLHKNLSQSDFLQRLFPHPLIPPVTICSILDRWQLEPISAEGAEMKLRQLALTGFYWLNL